MDTIHSENPDNPFLSNLPVSKLYSNSLIDQFSSVLLNSIGGKDFLILVLGESKSGKTTLLSRLTSQIEQDVKPCQLKIRKKDDQSFNTHKHPAFLYKSKNRQVIIIDDAHELNSQELAITLKNAWDNDKETNQLILFCEPRINTVISSLLKDMPKKASVNKLYIPCFDKEQTELYLNHYLEFANLSEEFSFSDKNINDIFEKSKGLPGKINNAAKDIFSSKSSFIKNTNKTKNKYVPLFAFLIISLFLVVATFFIFYEPNIVPVSNSNKIASNDPQKSITKKIQPSSKTNNSEIPTPSQDSSTKQNFTEETIVEKATNKTNNTKAKVEKAEISEPDNIISADSSISDPKPVVTKSAVAKQPTIEKKIKENPSNITNTSNVFREKWILTQEPQLFTIQVMAAKDDDAINRFLKLNINNQNEIAYYKMNSKTDIWYKFISGKYKTLDKAKRAIANLPDKIKNLGPWPRQFRSIQNEIHDFSKNHEVN